MNIEDKLKEILGHTYGGPSLSLESGKFVIYVWGCAPVGMNILGEGDTITEAILDYESRNKVDAIAPKGRRRRNGA